MKFPTVLAAFVLLASSASADDKPTCNLRDPKSVCDIKLTTHDLNIINTAFENAAMAHATWGPVWQDMLDQIQAQQPKDVAKPDK